jgi:hypothetical protein
MSDVATSVEAQRGPRWRTLEDVRGALTDDARSKVYRFVWLPLLALQLVLYTRVLVRFVADPAYAGAATDRFPLLHRNHLGNFVSIRSQPDVALLGIHLAMAWSWIAVCLVQKQLVARMASAVSANDEARFLRWRSIHAAVGTFMVAIGIVGILIGPVFVVANHGNPAMQRFLIGQPLFFVPAIVMVMVTARRKSRSIRHHLFWADTAFLGPAVASIWTEAGIHALGGIPAVGPDVAEVLASAVGGGLGALAVVLPAWLARRSGLARDAAASASRAQS